MRMGASIVAKQKPKPVVIAHLRLDHDLAGENSPERRRIKIINAYLGDRENALAELKLRGSPMALLIEKASAKGEELMAAQEIETAWFAISGALMFKPLNMERVGGGRRPDWSPKTCQAVEQYQIWANHWSIRKKSHLDHTLECVIAAVIDQRPIRAIAEDLGFGHSKIERAVLAGLRDYAARAGWVDNALARKWIAEAEITFKRRAVA